MRESIGIGFAITLCIIALFFAASGAVWSSNAAQYYFPPRIQHKCECGGKCKCRGGCIADKEEGK